MSSLCVFVTFYHFPFSNIYMELNQIWMTVLCMSWIIEQTIILIKIETHGYGRIISNERQTFNVLCEWKSGNEDESRTAVTVVLPWPLPHVSWPPPHHNSTTPYSFAARWGYPIIPHHVVLKHTLWWAGTPPLALSRPRHIRHGSAGSRKHSRITMRLILIWDFRTWALQLPGLDQTRNLLHLMCFLWISFKQLLFGFCQFPPWLRCGNCEALCSAPNFANLGSSSPLLTRVANCVLSQIDWKSSIHSALPHAMGWR